MENFCKTIVNYFMPDYFSYNKKEEKIYINYNSTDSNILRKKIKSNLYNNNYFYKFLFIDDLEYKCYTLKDAVNKNYIIHKNEIINSCKNICQNIYLKNKFIYKFPSPSNKRVYAHIVRSLYNNKIPNIILPTDIYEEMQTSVNTNKILLQKIPYKKYGDLFIYFTSNKLKYYEKYTIFYKILKIIKDLHSLNISHRDIKLENIVIDYSPNLELYLIDFDYATDNNNNYRFNGGTLYYAAPELFDKNIEIKNYNCVDIWALGVILYIFIFNTFPWSYADINCNYYNNYLNTHLYFNKKLLSLDIPPIHKNIYIKIFNYCFNKDYNKRKNIDNILNLM